MARSSTPSKFPTPPPRPSGTSVRSVARWCSIFPRWDGARSPLLSAGAAIGLGEPESDEAPRNNGGSSIVFEVEDVEAARALLVERKVKVGEITVIPETVKLLELNDPWGNRLMLSESMQP